MKPSPTLSCLSGLSMLGAACAPLIALRYAYAPFHFTASAIGCLLLAALSVFLWRRRCSQPSPALRLGLALGGLWIIEISINNFITPPLPLRDQVDNAFWALIALSILARALVSAAGGGRFRAGLESGLWSGTVSGLLACCAGLFLIVLGMRFITGDPLNQAEWSSVLAAGDPAPSMAAYFAWETFAGAFMHLLILGAGMGALLGALGGLAGMLVSHFNAGGPG